INLTIRSDRMGTCQGARVVYACVGYCDSSAFPSRYSVLLASNFTHNITSMSRCCTISKSIK
ncbi:glycoprotein hormone alpha-2, partial [Clarias magur]